jgi:hypothetical protein
MNIITATEQYERWLRHRTPVIESDLRLKHKRMAESPFFFLRATFYRWVQLWPEVCPDLAKFPTVLAVGDLHVENFGTWRDLEGRLIWGVNDFDESYRMAFANDLVRLAVSAHLAVQEGHLSIKGRSICEALLSGYRESIEAGGRPFVLGEHNGWLRDIAEGELRDPVHFWEKMDALPQAKGRFSSTPLALLRRALPEKGLSCRIVRRIAGLGSLGHQRLVAIAHWRGGRIAREVKVLVPSACAWVSAESARTKILYRDIVDHAVRCPDPFLRFAGSWIVRRLSPHCSRVELKMLPADRDELKLLYAMGWETANIHLGTRVALPVIRRSLRRQRSTWLHEAAKAMSETVDQDWKEWKKQTPAA